MKNGTKLRILFLYQYLIHHTDAEHPLTTSELMKILKDEYNLKVSRNTISNDLAMLHDCGLNIEHYTSTQNKYYYDGQVYDLPELKVLADAISASKFITQKKSNTLIAKMLDLTNEHSASMLRRHIYTQGRVKTENENGYYIVDSINEAIDLHRKIQFKYTDYDVYKKKFITNQGKPYTVSPYSLVWDGDFYYLRGFCDERQSMRNFRVDRIDRQPEILDEMGVAAPVNYDFSGYRQPVFQMYDTDESQIVSLVCDVSVMKMMIDQFGKEFKTKVIDEATFQADVEVCISPTFFRWVFGFGGKIKLIGPIEVREQYRQMLLQAASN